MNYQIIGGDFPAVVCTMAPGESMITERGSMIWMSPNMQMETRGTSLGKAFGRMFTGESIFQNVYTALRQEGLIAFGSSFPGSIKTITLGRGESIIAQKRAFLASTSEVELSTFFQKKAITGFFSGEGFVMQRITGPGIVFLEIDGAEQTYQLDPGQSIVIDTGNLAMMDETCSITIESVPGLKNKLLGGEGFFNTVVTGPGRVTLQTMPINAIAASIASFLPSSGS